MSLAYSFLILLIKRLTFILEDGITSVGKNITTTRPTAIMKIFKSCTCLLMTDYNNNCSVDSRIKGRAITVVIWTDQNLLMILLYVSK